MENASKALIMAGTILIAIMVVSLFFLMFNSLSDYQATNQKTTAEQQVVAFNNEYAGYARDNVRGTELVSLLNKVIDYNERKAEIEGVSGNEGESIAFKPITVKVRINDSKSLISNPDGEKKLFTKNFYQISSNTQNSDLKSILEWAQEVQNNYGRDSIQGLVSNTTAIFLKNEKDENKQKEAVKKYNSLVSGKYQVTDYKQLQNDKDLVYRYYEFTQFKRAYFKCTETKYDKNTGRIIEMEFEFTGKLN